MLICLARATNWWTFWPLRMPLKCVSKAFLFFVGYECFRDRFRAQIFQLDLGPMRPLPLPHLVSHLLINTNLLTSYVTLVICKNILNFSSSWSKSSETNPWCRLLCFSASHGWTQHLLFLVFETLLCLLLSFINCEHADFLF